MVLIVFVLFEKSVLSRVLILPILIYFKIRGVGLSAQRKKIRFGPKKLVLAHVLLGKQ